MRDGYTTTAAEIIEDARNGKGCLGRAHADEPVFVVRASDVLFNRVVRFWISEAQEEGVKPPKIASAAAVLADGTDWRGAHSIKVPD